MPDPSGPLTHGNDGEDSTCVVIPEGFCRGSVVMNKATTLTTDSRLRLSGMTITTQEVDSENSLIDPVQKHYGVPPNGNGGSSG